MAPSRLMAVLLALLVLVLAAACQPAASDKAGSETVVLHLASIDAVDDNPRSAGPMEFVAALEEVSDGRLRVEVDITSFDGVEADAEARLVAAIAAGEVDGGWPATRAFAAAGLSGLEMIEAPLTLTNEGAVDALVTSPVGEELLDRLDGTGVVALGMAVGPLRRPFAVSTPLLGPASWAGRKVRSFNSPVQDAAISALGAEPVHAGAGWTRLTSAGDLDALELDVSQYHANGSSTEAGVLTSDVVLWPKVFVLTLSQERWDDLSGVQQDWVRQAAARARAASVAADHDEGPLLEELCSRGVTLHEAGAAARNALRERLEPVLRDLATDPLWPQLEQIATEHPDPGALPDVPCVARVDYEITSGIDVPREQARLPEGTYRVSLSSEDVERALGPGKESTTGVWTLRIDGPTFELDCVPHEQSTGRDCDNTEDLHGTGFDVNPMLAGHLRGSGDVVYLVNDPQLARARSDCTFPAGIQLQQESCYPRLVDRVRWSFDGRQLAFTDLVADIGTWQYVVKPWRRIGD